MTSTCLTFFSAISLTQLLPQRNNNINVIVDRIGEVMQSKGGYLDTEDTMFEPDLQIIGYGKKNKKYKIPLVPTVWF